MAKVWRPTEPVNKKMFEKLGLSIDPKNIPNQRLDKSVVAKKIEEKQAQKELEIKVIEEKYKALEVASVEAEPADPKPGKGG